MDKKITSIWIGGIHAVEQALEQKNIIQVEVVSNKKSKNLTALLAQIQNANIPIKFCENYQIDMRLPHVKHQGIAAKCRLEQKAQSWQEIAAGSKNPLLLVLDNIQDPHNLGACLRSALAFGVDCVLIPNNNSASINPTVHKVSCGASEILPIFQTSNLNREINLMKEQGIWIVGGAMGMRSRSLYCIDFGSLPLAVIVGNEATGIRPSLQEKCDFLAEIPINSAMESLNVSVASAILLYEIKRQRALATKL